MSFFVKKYIALPDMPTPEEGRVESTLDPETEARFLACIAFANANLAKRKKLLALLESQMVLMRTAEERAKLKVVIKDMERAILGSYRFRHEYAEKLGLGEKYPIPN